jgi:hypothetical protein
MESLIEQICAKKELKGIDRKIVQEFLDNYAKKHKINKEKLTLSEQKIVLTDIRRELRALTGRFHSFDAKQEAIHLLLKKREYATILKLHTSTREREAFYQKLRTTIDTYAPKSILDIGCGINPLVCARPNCTYYAYDIQAEDLALLEKFGEQEGLILKTVHTDIRKCTQFPMVDMVLAFKIFDLLDTKGHANATRILRLLRTPVVLASFATRSLSGKKFANSRRIWFERLLKAEGYSYTRNVESNECFYLARKERSDTR